MRAHERARRFIATSDDEAISSAEMPRYVVGRIFHERSQIPGADGGAELWCGVSSETPRKMGRLGRE
jgi:hypothetical protein